MYNRNTLIALAIKYNGDYSLIKRHIEKAVNDDNVMPIECDNCITIFDDDYPTELFDLDNPPFVLFYKGNKDLLKTTKIGVIGSLSACEYALAATKQLVLKESEHTVVSGLAFGIDAQACRYAKNTIGVLGCGIDYIYPLGNKELFRKVEEEGLIISEYPGMTKPEAKNFLTRNRIVAALSDTVYAMQIDSSVKSGPMDTVNTALSLNRTVKILPYSIFDVNGFDNNQLICDAGFPIITTLDIEMPFWEE